MSRIERGKANPSLDAIEIVAGGLKVSVVKLFEDS
jgi:transcriptional regulator with XRE-family HTH domain